MEGQNRPGTIIEHDDRWLLKPLRGHAVSRINWQSDHIELAFDDGNFHILIGYDAELSAKTLAKDSPNRHGINHWSRLQIEEFLAARIVSAVLFKSGAVRLAFKNGWILFIGADSHDYPPEVRFNNRTLWNPTGIVDRSIFDVQPIDPWTGQQVTPPDWPSRPDYLQDRSESDDIND
ncbi:hypothetical protein [Nocardia cerradoensis]|uniref:Uncharacterized protein n=1 Tax=Nocardia cerradoensis TaxID=85688 RepID=A0A231H575_9NOCA|nr:hypothetical protein [Nocardia cerradoensis]NKY44297.1 hypothetical protein [Nocardia cerradoensis]OXR43990.1 hypothetical protein B7C42_03546 [Nocardia cerradoensis]